MTTKRVALGAVIVVIWALILIVLGLRAEAKASREKFHQNAVLVLRQQREALRQLRPAHESESGYLLAEDAYVHAMSDLEDFEANDPDITEERLTNDIEELRFDIDEIGYPSYLDDRSKS